MSPRARRRPQGRPAQRTDATLVDGLVWAKAKELSQGNARRIRFVSPTELLVVNQPVRGRR